MSSRLFLLRTLKSGLFSSRLAHSGLVTFALVISQGYEATAQMALPQLIAQSYSVRQPVSNINLIYVNSITGSNTTGTGSEQAPFKTITYALRVARPNTVILLASGIYTQETGETFPIVMKPRVTIQGDPRIRGRNTLIYGGGFYQSPTLGDQNITLLAADASGLTGVTVTNPFTNGYGVWIESVNPVITDNTFSGSKKDGISIAGNSAPVIQNNIFVNNGANGITLQSSAPASLRESASSNQAVDSAASAPRVNDPITPPVGVMIPVPQPATTVAASGNSSISAASFPVPAQLSSVNQSRNTLAGSPIVQVSSQPLAPTGTLSVSSPALPTVQIKPTAVLAPTSTIPVPAVQKMSSRPTSITNTPVVQPAPTQPAVSTASAIEIPVPPPETVTLRPVRSAVSPTRDRQSTKNTNLKVYSSLSTNSRINQPSALAVVSPSIPAPPPISNRQNFSRSNLVAPGILPVPSSKIPVGNAGASGGNRVPPPPAFAMVPGLRYRVLVEPLDETQTIQVKSLVPGAFTTVVRGRRLVQAGAFVERDKADELRQILASNGLRAMIEEL